MLLRREYRKYARNDARTSRELILANLVETQCSDSVRNGLDNLDGELINKKRSATRRRTHFNYRLHTGFNGFIENFRQPCLLDSGERCWLVVNKRCHDVHRLKHHYFPIPNHKQSDIPSGRTLGPNKPLYSIIFLMDCSNVESINPRRPSEVPVDCIIRCIDLSVCLRIAARATGSSPHDPKMSREQVSLPYIVMSKSISC